MDKKTVRNVLDWYKHAHTKGVSNDVVSVVRCKNCIHYMPYDWMFSEVRKSESIEDYPQNEIGCELVDHHINSNDYCSYGERKDD